LVKGFSTPVHMLFIDSFSRFLHRSDSQKIGEPLGSLGDDFPHWNQNQSKINFRIPS